MQTEKLGFFLFFFFFLGKFLPSAGDRGASFTKQKSGTETIPFPPPSIPGAAGGQNVLTKSKVRMRCLLLVSTGPMLQSLRIEAIEGTSTLFFPHSPPTGAAGTRDTSVGFSDFLCFFGRWNLIGGLAQRAPKTKNLPRKKNGQKMKGVKKRRGGLGRGGF